MRVRRLLTVSPDTDPLWIRLYVQPYADQWAATRVGDEVLPPGLGSVTGLTFFGATPEHAEREATADLGMAEPTKYDTPQGRTTPDRPMAPRARERWTTWNRRITVSWGGVRPHARAGSTGDGAAPRVGPRHEC